MTAFGRFLDGVFGRGEHAITVPALDGAFRPNDGLDRAEAAARMIAPDALAVLNGRLVVASGAELLEANGAPLRSFPAEIAFMAELPDGGLAVGLAGGAVQFIGGARDGGSITLPAGLSCPTAAAADGADALILANGSAKNGLSEWRRDLLEKGRTGSVWRVSLADGRATPLADGLAWPAGLLVRDGAVVVSEAWRSRLLRIDAKGARTEIVGNLPGYPGRLSAGEGRVWLAVFAPRSQLLEFVLREDAFRTRMMHEIEPDLWIAPSLRTGRHALEPLQAGAVKQLGVVKPWAPVRSFGMAVELDADLRPRRSFQSRADGARHGVTSLREADGRLWFAAKGDGVLGVIDLEDAA